MLETEQKGAMWYVAANPLGRPQHLIADDCAGDPGHSHRGIWQSGLVVFTAYFP